MHNFKHLCIFNQNIFETPMRVQLQTLSKLHGLAFVSKQIFLEKFSGKLRHTGWAVTYKVDEF